MSTAELFDAAPAAADRQQVFITIRRPDDWHVHLRDAAVLQAVLPYTAAQFARAIIMPNLAPPTEPAGQNRPGAPPGWRARGGLWSAPRMHPMQKDKDDD